MEISIVGADMAMRQWRLEAAGLPHAVVKTRKCGSEGSRVVAAGWGVRASWRCPRRGLDPNSLIVTRPGAAVEALPRRYRKSTDIRACDVGLQTQQLPGYSRLNSRQIDKPRVWTCTGGCRSPSGDFQYGSGGRKIQIRNAGEEWFRRPDVPVLLGLNSAEAKSPIQIFTVNNQYLPAGSYMQKGDQKASAPAPTKPNRA